MDKLWKSKIIGRATKITIFNSNIKLVLQYASESWTFTHRTINRLQVFINKCLCRIVNVHWPDKISNSDLCTNTDEETELIQIKRRKWRWIEHTLGSVHISGKCRQHCQTNFAVETTGTQKKRTTKEYLEK